MREKQRQRIDNFQDELQNENFHEDDIHADNQFVFFIVLGDDLKVYDTSIKRNCLYLF